MAGAELAHPVLTGLLIHSVPSPSRAKISAPFSFFFTVCTGKLTALGRQMYKCPPFPLRCKACIAAPLGTTWLNRPCLAAFSPSLPPPGLCVPGATVLFLRAEVPLPSSFPTQHACLVHPVKSLSSGLPPPYCFAPLFSHAQLPQGFTALKRDARWWSVAAFNPSLWGMVLSRAGLLARGERRSWR